MEKPSLNFHAHIEIMGHNRIAGFISELKIGNDTFVRVDVPMTKTHEAFTKMLSPNAIYAITPVDEKTANLLAENIQARPIQIYSLGNLFKEQINALLESGKLIKPQLVEGEKEDDEEEDTPW